MLDEDLTQWIGKTETLDDVVTLAPLKALAATLDHKDPLQQSGAAVAPCRHWLYFLPLLPQSTIGADGHPRRGGFLPPVPLPRRMWAASRMEFIHDLQPGRAITRTSTIADVIAKQGRTGPLVFVRVHHEITDTRGVAITEDQEIVYRGLEAVGGVTPLPPAARTDEQFSRRIIPDPVLLFRYSALTFNGHRIHYDRPYATGAEAYPGLVVHGPLIATLLIDQLQHAHPRARVQSFEFKAISPLFDTSPFDVCGRLDGDSAVLWARGPTGQLAMQGSANLTTA